MLVKHLCTSQLKLKTEKQCRFSEALLRFVSNPDVVDLCWEADFSKVLFSDAPICQTGRKSHTQSECQVCVWICCSKIRTQKKRCHCRPCDEAGTVEYPSIRNLQIRVVRVREDVLIARVAGAVEQVISHLRTDKFDTNTSRTELPYLNLSEGSENKHRSRPVWMGVLTSISRLNNTATMKVVLSDVW